jgi:hypothetical protein
MKTIEELKAIARKINMEELREEISEKWVDIKINNHLERNPHLALSNQEIKELILENDLVASFFAKDPSRQNFTEKIISKTIKSIEGVENFEDLPSSTYWYLVDGKVVKLKSRPIGIKNIDYIFSFRGKRFVCTQKYTKDAGGAQDNQFNDIVSFLQQSLNMEEGTIAVAIVDGAYYTKEKIEKLRAINDKALVVSGFELEEVLNEKY